MASVQSHNLAFRGKQVPTAPEPEESAGATEQEAIHQAAHSRTIQTINDRSISHLTNRNSWRLRDAAEELVSDRQALLPVSSQEAATALTKGKGKGGKRTNALPLVPAQEFPVQKSLEYLRLHKSAAVSAAFSAAATTILRALEQKAHGGNADLADEDDEKPDFSLGSVTSSGSPANNDTDDMKHLPKVLLQKRKIAALRRAALVRSSENKEWAKKRTPKTTSDSAGVVSSSAAADPSNNNSNKSGKKRKADVLPDLATSGNKKAATASKPNEVTSSTSETNSNANTTPSGPKFTRNTPASSAAALDHRFTSSRAILCAAGNLVFAALTPRLEGREELEPNEVPQKSSEKVNLGAVLVQANIYAQRTIAIVENAVKRSDLRHKYRQENARYRHAFTSNVDNSDSSGKKHYLELPNLFAWRDDKDESEMTPSPWSDFIFDEEDTVPYHPNEAALSKPWQTFCRPRLRSILETGCGHALYHDVQWYSRHGRLAHFLKAFRRSEKSWGPYETESQSKKHFGPHLIVTTKPDVTKFAQEFYDMKSHLPIVVDREEDDNPMRALVYNGNKRQRLKLRKHFPEATGLAESPFHVVIVSYTDFLEDYLHFCQMNFEVAILDNGASWMAAAMGDPNSALATVWDQGIWSKHHHAGVAGTVSSSEPWDYGVESISEAAAKEACIGLTARHRIMTASHMRAENKSTTELLPISAIVSFLAPNFSAVVQEEWDRSNIAKDVESMEHFRKLICRSTVVHHESSDLRDMYELALLALEGQVEFPERLGDPIAPDLISDDDFVSAEKATFSRRSCLSWLGTEQTDWLRYELGSTEFHHILEYVKMSTKHGHFCEEIATASSTTSSGATGQVGGTMAYRMAVCCLRTFGSEQGLRQHISAQHAPPGTWLCRSCGSDCITSQARTHHERSCGQPSSTSTDQGGIAGAPPTVGQGGPKGVGKKKSRSVAAQPSVASPEEKDADGSLRVPGYRGVWVNKEGKHFIKIDKKRFTGDGDTLVLFDSNDAAARKYDAIISERAEENQTLELNFKPNGTRNMYEDASSSTASGLGGSANVVPLLSVINIKDLPPDVKPLLRDPRQTSRTGGNSKRHVYAYRGVCRQARKGHDRWQSQISFMGVNHYLGTFDSEWDAAAIYAWAHLILYGEEATKQAQKEGEEAAEAYEQEKRDIAAGKIPAEPPKPEKPKKQQPKKKKPEAGKTPSPKTKTVKPDAGAGKKEDTTGAKKRKAKSKPAESKPAEKKAKVDPKVLKSEKEAMNAILSLGVSKTPVLGPREKIESTDTAQLESMALERLRACRLSYSVGEQSMSTSPAIEAVRPCLPVGDSSNSLGAAMLVGLPHDLGWSLEDFVESSIEDQTLAMAAVQVLAAEYDEDGVNEKFRSIMQGSVCILGRATERKSQLFRSLVGSSVAIGGVIGEIDCYVGGLPTSTSRAACMRYAQGEFQFCCLSDQDVVTLNGQRVTSGMGWVALDHNDVCSVGPRVFVFVLPK